MAKQQSFAEKAAKAGLERGVKCPKCGTTLQPILYISSERNQKSGAYRFSQKRVQVCKCNEKMIYG
jgi:uncharacterized OB-fold protein